MELTEAMKLIDEQWVRKRKGYRVRFQKLADGALQTDYCPDMEKAPFDSDVTAWRLAWKLFKASPFAGGEIGEGDLVNIQVVDENDEPSTYYATNEVTVFNAVTGS